MHYTQLSNEQSSMIVVFYTLFEQLDVFFFFLTLSASMYVRKTYKTRDLCRINHVYNFFLNN